MIGFAARLLGRGIGAGASVLKYPLARIAAGGAVGAGYGFAQPANTLESRTKSAVAYGIGGGLIGAATMPWFMKAAAATGAAATGVGVRGGVGLLKKVSPKMVTRTAERAIPANAPAFAKPELYSYKTLEWPFGRMAGKIGLAGGALYGASVLARSSPREVSATANQFGQPEGIAPISPVSRSRLALQNSTDGLVLGMHRHRHG